MRHVADDDIFAGIVSGEEEEEEKDVHRVEVESNLFGFLSSSGYCGYLSH
jgi:hypothetical protein